MIVGIDLGTTNSLVCAWRDSEAQIIPNALGQRMTPSVVGVDDSGEILVGMAARERLRTHPELTTAAFKRHMGTSREVTLGRKHRFRSEELSALVLKSLKADAEAWLGHEIEEAVVSVPAYFNDSQRRATRTAGTLAGLEVARLVNEPTAAALAYGLHRRDLESKFLVFDLGGGTFDVSILELFEGVMEVKASGGDNFLGGEDFVDVLVKAFLEQAGGLTDADRKELDGKTQAVLREEGERAKRAITRDRSATMALRLGERELFWPVDESAFAGIAQPLLDRLANPVKRGLRDAGLSPGDLDEIVLVGGATRMPIVRRLVARMFGRMPTVHIDPDEVVAKGAAIQGALKMRDAELKDVVVTDVCPYSLGVEVAEPLGRGATRGGIYLPIIERNVTVPVSRVERLYTVTDYQRVVAVQIFQGESRNVSDNIQLGKISLDVPSAPAGEEQVDVRFTYDINGVLEVEATAVGTGVRKRMVIVQNPGLMTQREIEKRLRTLSKLKIHPRDREENRVLLARAERFYEEHLGEVRRAIGMEIARFESVMDGQNVDEVNEARQRLNAILDEFEG